MRISGTWKHDLRKCTCIDSRPKLPNTHHILTLIRGRASLPVGRAAFKAVELLLKWLVGSTPTSSAVLLVQVPDITAIK